MLAIAARERAADALCQGDMVSLPFGDSTFDAVLSQQGLPFASEPGRALGEMRRVLRRGGLLALASFGPLEECPAYTAIAAALARVTDAAEAVLPPFALSDPARLVALVEAAGFQRIAVESVEVRIRAPAARDFILSLAAGGSAMRRVMARVPADRRPAVLADVEAALARYQGADGFSAPQRCILVSARAD